MQVQSSFLMIDNLMALEGSGDMMQHHQYREV